MIKKEELITLIETMRATLLEDDDSIKEVLSSVAEDTALRAAFIACNNPVSEDETTDCVLEDSTVVDVPDNVVSGYFK